MRQWKWLPLMLICTLSIGVYLNTLHNTFVYDDEYYVVNNLQIRSWRNLPEIFLSSYPAHAEKQGLYRPLVTLSYMIDYTFWMLNPAGYHLTNLFLHSLNSLLVYLLVLCLFPAQSILALFSALLFALHPIHTEAVTWVVGRAELLAVTFYFLTLIFWQKSVHSAAVPQRRGWYTVSLGTFFLALLAKEIAITLPVMVFVIMYLVYKSDPIQQTQSSHSSTAPSFSSAIGNFSFPVGYFLVALCYLGLRYTVLGGMGPQGIYQFFPEVSLPWRMVIGSTVFLYYLKLLLLPLPLNVDYVIPAMHFFSFSTLLFTGFGLLLYGILLSLKLCPLRRQHVSAERMLWSLSLGWIPLTLLPVLHILPIGTVMAERFLYIPSFGFTLLAGWVVTRGLESSRWTLSLCTSALLALLLVGYAVQTIQRNREWRDAKALWQQTITVSPQSHNAYNNLGVAYFLEGAFPEAIAAYETALRLKPANPLPYMNIGLILEQQGDLEQAIRYHQKALALNPAYAEAHLNLGVAYFKKGWIDQAIAEQQEAIRLYPTFAQAHSHLGLSYLKKGWLDKALEEQQIAVAVNPFSPEIQTNLGIIYYRLGRFSEAIDHFTRALALGPARSDLFAYLGAVYFAQGDISQAMQAYQKALELNPRNVQAHQYLGIIYLRQQQSDKAVIHWQNALRFGSSPQKVQEEIVTALVQLQDRAPGDQMLLQPEKGSRE